MNTIWKRFGPKNANVARCWGGALLLLVAGWAGTGCNVQLSLGSGLTHLTGFATRNAAGELAAATTQLEVENQFGELQVVVADAGSPNWTWKLETRAKTDALARSAADEVRFTAETNGTSVRLVVTLPKERRNRHFDSQLIVHAPKTCAVTARNAFGTLRVAGVDGPVEAKDEFGALTVENIKGEVRAQTAFAALRVREVGPARLKNQNGKLEATGVQGNVDAETSFAALTVTGVSGRAEVRNQNGAITLKDIRGAVQARTSFDRLLATDLGGPLQAANQNGSISATRVAGAVELKTSFAAIELVHTDGGAVLRNQNGHIHAREVAGELRAETSFDKIDVAGTGTRFYCRNHNAAIVIEATGPTLAEVDARTSFGNLEVRLPADAQPTLTAHTSFGQVQADFPIQPKDTPPVPGHPRVRLENQNGSIRVHALK